MKKSPYEPRGFQNRGGHQPKSRSDELPKAPAGGTGERGQDDDLVTERMQLEIEAQKLLNAERKINIDIQSSQAKRILFGLSMERAENARRNIECLIKANSLDWSTIENGRNLFKDAILGNMKVLKEFASQEPPKLS